MGRARPAGVVRERRKGKREGERGRWNAWCRTNPQVSVSFGSDGEKGEKEKKEGKKKGKEGEEKE